MPKFYMIIAPKNIFSRILVGKCLPCRQSPTPIRHQPGFLGSLYTQNVFAGRPPSPTPLGSLQRSPRSRSWWGGGSLPLPKNPSPAPGLRPQSDHPLPNSFGRHWTKGPRYQSGRDRELVTQEAWWVVAVSSLLYYSNRQTDSQP